jgi:hypothetical protein
VLPEPRQPEDAATIARKMLSLVAGKKLLVTSSLGISFYPDHDRNPSLLIRPAETATVCTLPRSANYSEVRNFLHRDP